MPVKKTGGSWVIPSHYSYPADGGARVGKTSGGVRAVQRGRLITNDANRHEELGVVDPFTEDVTKKGRGKRVVLKDTTGGVLVDLIIGNRVADSDGLNFVRDANDAAVYTAKVDAEISTKFVDWVETDLLKLKAEDIRSALISDYSVDEQKGTIDMRSNTELKRKEGATEWESPQTPADKRLAKETVDKIFSQATALRLAGVRKFSLNWLQQSGFYPTDSVELLNRPDSLRIKILNKDYALFANEGRVDLTTKDGLRYSMVFGGISLENEDKPSAEADKAKKEEKKDAEKKDDKTAAGHNRYMSVYVTYDPNADEDAKKAAAEKKDDKKDGDKPAPGRERAAKAQARFGQFFYVISDTDFKALRPGLDKLFEAKPAEPAKPADGAAKPGDGAAKPGDGAVRPADGAALPPAAPVEVKPAAPAPAP